LISQIAGFFARPTNIIAILALASLIVAVANKRVAHKLAAISIIALSIGALSPLGNVLLTPLEQRFPYMRYPTGPVAGIIVLGGSYDSQAGYVNTLILHEDTEPVAVVADLTKRYKDARVIFSGGTASIFGTTGPSEAFAAEKFFRSVGIPPERIVIENKSRNTEENAKFTKEVLHPQPSERWLLVTNAFHMPRAIGAFRRAGFNVQSFSVGWRTHGWRDFYWPTSSATENLRRMDIAVREWIGLTVYYWLGYSSAWLPADEP
jgi:uncharacterized SAM-binding protein YcdF (DUF218 family)